MSQTQQLPQIFIVRINFKNGAQFNLTYRDVGPANDIAQVVSAAQKAARMGRPAAEAVCKVQDEGGRDFYICGDEVFAVQFVDCAMEIRENIRNMIILERTESQLRELAGLPPINVPAAPAATNGHAPASEAAIGRAPSTFAS